MEPLYDLKDSKHDSVLIGKKSFVCDFLNVDEKVYKDVYMPSEDTFTLIDAIHIDLSYNIASMNIDQVIEVG